MSKYLMIDLNRINDKKYIKDFNDKLYGKNKCRVHFHAIKKNAKNYLEGAIYFEIKDYIYCLPIRRMFDNKDRFLNGCKEDILNHLLSDFQACVHPFYSNGDYNLTLEIKNKATVYVRSKNQFSIILHEKTGRDLI